MRIIISPAKKMNVDTDSLAWQDLPQFIDCAEYLRDSLQKLSFEERKALWKCNDSIARLNTERLEDMDLRRNLTPAVLAYEGIQYQYMAPGVFSNEEFSYLQQHLRILSGFYGMLRPFDGVVPYRLEMQAKLNNCEGKDLYKYWGDKLYRQMEKETDCVINLASREYSVCISAYRKPELRFITCVFGEEKGGKVLEKGTLCKMARGEMVRFMAENRITEPEQLKSFDRLQHRFAPEHSTEETFVFLREDKE